MLARRYSLSFYNLGRYGAGTMQRAAVDPAFVVCKFLQDYGAVWLRHFPNSARRAHWQIAQFVRTQQDGVLFSSVRGRMNDVYGMDENTCVLRVQELISEGFIEADGEAIRASTCLIATPKFADMFDRHILESVEVFHDAARAIDPKVQRLARLSQGAELNKAFLRFFADFLELWNEHRSQFLKRTIPQSPAQRLKALHALKTMPYWHIFTTAWMHHHPLGEARRPYLLIDDFHREIYEHLNVGMKATTGYVQDMIDWGFLRRLNKDDGVPRGKFAVRMDNAVFDTFQTAYAAGADLLVTAARGLNQLAIRDADDADVLKFRALR